MLREYDLLVYVQELMENFLFNIPDMHTVGSFFSCTLGLGSTVDLILATLQSPTHSWKALIPTFCLCFLIITQSPCLCASVPCHSSDPYWRKTFVAALQAVSSYWNSWKLGRLRCSQTVLYMLKWLRFHCLHTLCQSTQHNATICIICPFHSYLHLLLFIVHPLCLKTGIHLDTETEHNKVWYF